MYNASKSTAAGSGLTLAMTGLSGLALWLFIALVLICVGAILLMIASRRSKKKVNAELA